MSADEGDPRSLAAAATGDGDAADAAMSATDAAADMAGAGSSDSGSSPLGRLLDGLLETEPDETPSDYPDLPEPTAHAVIGAKKFLNGVADRAIDRGTPAAMNFALAGVGSLDAGDSESDGDNSESGVSVHE